MKNSVASARSRTAIAVASSALGIATGLNDVMEPPNRARLNDSLGHASTVIISPEPLVTRLTLLRRDLLLLGVIPADIEEAVAVGTPHARPPLFESSPRAAVRAHAIACPPRHG